MPCNDTWKRWRQYVNFWWIRSPAGWGSAQACEPLLAGQEEPAGSWETALGSDGARKGSSETGSKQCLVLFSRQVWCVLFAIKWNYTVYCWFCWLGRECPHPWSWILVILPRKKECYLQIHRPLQSQFLVKEKKSPADLPVPRRTPTSGSQDPRQSTRLANYFKVWPHRITYCIIFWWLSSTRTHATVYFYASDALPYHCHLVGTETSWSFTCMPPACIEAPAHAPCLSTSL